MAHGPPEARQGDQGEDGGADEGSPLVAQDRRAVARHTVRGPGGHHQLQEAEYPQDDLCMGVPSLGASHHGHGVLQG